MIRAWWNHDRIRVSPEEGKLLRTQPGDFLVVAGMPIEVVSRTVHEGPLGFDLQLQCREGSRIATLQIQLTLDGTVESIHCDDLKTGRIITPCDLDVWMRRRMV